MTTVLSRRGIKGWGNSLLKYNNDIVEGGALKRIGIAGRCGASQVAEDRTISRRSFLRLGTTLAGAAAFGGLAASRTKDAVADTTTFPGIRWYPVMGVYRGATSGWTSKRTLLQDQYDFWVGTSRESRYLDLGDVNAERYWFAGGQKIE